MGHWFFLFTTNGLMSIFWHVMLQFAGKDLDGITFLNVLENVSQAVLVNSSDTCKGCSFVRDSNMSQATLYKIILYNL
jgi:hypothetical protein